MHTNKLKRVAVFCGSSYGIRNEYADAAKELGQEMAKRGMALVYGGGGKGLMGVIAKSVRENGGYVIGVLPESMNVPAVRKNAMENELIIVNGMHERKNKMYQMSDAFIAMPGGIGTIEEIMEIYTWRQLGYHDKNIGLLNPEDYWNDLISMLDKSTEEGFMSNEIRRALIAENDPSTLLDRLEMDSYTLPPKIG